MRLWSIGKGIAIMGRVLFFTISGLNRLKKERFILKDCQEIICYAMNTDGMEGLLLV